jgi:hypothetical protein
MNRGGTVVAPPPTPNSPIAAAAAAAAAGAIAATAATEQGRRRRRPSGQQVPQLPSRADLIAGAHARHRPTVRRRCSSSSSSSRGVRNCSRAAPHQPLPHTAPPTIALAAGSHHRRIRPGGRPRVHRSRREQRGVWVGEGALGGEAEALRGGRGRRQPLASAHDEHAAAAAAPAARRRLTRRGAHCAPRQSHGRVVVVLRGDARRRARRSSSRSCSCSSSTSRLIARGRCMALREQQQLALGCPSGGHGVRAGAGLAP